MDLIITDEFFESVDEIRKIALSVDYTTHEEIFEQTGATGWVGRRSKKLSSFNDSFLDECEKKILLHLEEVFGVSGLKITSFFHICYEELKWTTQEFGLYKYHKDFLPAAGVVYLTPNAPKDMGTSVLDGDNNKIVNVDNIYNRLVTYPGDYIHAVTNVFGDTNENGRLTLSFFLHTEQDDLDYGNP